MRPPSGDKLLAARKQAEGVVRIDLETGKIENLARKDVPRRGPPDGAR